MSRPEPSRDRSRAWFECTISEFRSTEVERVIGKLTMESEFAVTPVIAITLKPEVTAQPALRLCSRHAAPVRRRSRGKVDYVLRVKIHSGAQPVAVALIEAKKDSRPPRHGHLRAARRLIRFHPSAQVLRSDVCLPRKPRDAGTQLTSRGRTARTAESARKGQSG